MAAIRIAHLTHWQLPSDDTATNQIVQHAAALVRAGAPVDLVLPRGPGAARDEARLRERLREHYGTDCGFGLRQLGSRVDAVEWLSHGVHAVLGSAYATRQRYDVVHTRDLESALLSLQLGRQVLFENHRPFTRRSRWHRALLLRAVRRPNLLGIVTHSRFVAEKYREDGVPSEKLTALHNGFDPLPFVVERSPSAARALLGWPERLTVVYAGRIAALKRIDLLLDAAKAAPELEWVLAGRADTAEAAPFVALGGQLPNVRFPGFFRGERLAPVLQAADVLVLPPARDAVKHSEQSGLPIKLFQYLGAGRPILLPELPDTAELLMGERNCVRVIPNDLIAFLAALRSLLADPVRRERLGAEARATVAGHTWDARARAFLAFLHERRQSSG